MYLYADECGDPGFNEYDPEFKKTEPFLVFCILLIEDNKSKHKIERMVRKTITDLRKHYEKEHKGEIPKELQKEGLSGSMLAKHPDIQLRFFKRIARRDIKHHIYLALFDKRKLKQTLPREEGRRYALLFTNLFLSSYHFPKNQKFVAFVVHRRYERKVERKRFKQMILNPFVKKRRTSIPRKKTILWVFNGKVVNHPSLQICDVIAYFGYTKLRMDSFCLDDGKLRGKKWRKTKERELQIKRAEWEKAFMVLKPKIAVWRKPQFFKRRI